MENISHFLREALHHQVSNAMTISHWTDMFARRLTVMDIATTTANKLTC